MDFSKALKEPEFSPSINSPSYLSHSSTSTFLECGEQYRLKNRYGFKDNHTWFSTLAGAVIHEVTEAIDRAEADGADPEFAYSMHVDECIDKFREKIKYATEIEGLEVKASGQKREDITSEVGGPNKRDQEWWEYHMPLLIQKWQLWKSESGMTILKDDDGVPAIELEMQANINGVTLVGSIDRVMVDSFGQYTILDLKTGKAPASRMQPLLYALMFRHAFDEMPAFSAYWLPLGQRKDGGKLVPIESGKFLQYEVTEAGLEAVLHTYDMAYKAIESGLFLPNPDGADCRNCDVIDLCAYQNGKDAWKVPLQSIVVPREQVTTELPGTTEAE